MSMQSVFDTVVLAMRKQGRPSTNDRGHCRYRNATRDEVGKVTVLQCAIGTLLTPRTYVDSIEGVSVKSLPLFVRNELAKLVLADEHMTTEQGLSFLSDMQGAHDRFAGNAMPPQVWLHMFLEHAKEVAENFGLDQRAITQPLEETADA